MRSKLSASSIVQLETLILAQLKIKPHTARELERATGAAHSVLGRRLQLMSEQGAVHFLLNPFGITKQRPPRVWLIGPGSETPHDPADHPQRILTKAEPVGAQRDPLVSALFGPASNARRCIDCRIGEGAAHDGDCRIARYV